LNLEKDGGEGKCFEQRLADGYLKLYLSNTAARDFSLVCDSFIVLLRTGFLPLHMRIQGWMILATVGTSNFSETPRKSICHLPQNDRRKKGRLKRGGKLFAELR
jgi:hypothetical protein